MKPLNLSDNPDDEEETLSFLPNDPPMNITVSTNKNNNDTNRKRNQQKHDGKSRNRKRRNHPSFRPKRKSSGFCLPWMVETILFMMIIASVVVIKALHRAKLYGFDKESEIVHQWNDLKLEDIDHWCLNKDVTDCKCSNPLTPMPRYNHYSWTHAYHQNVRAARNIKKDRSYRDLDVVFLGDSILEGFNGMKFGNILIPSFRIKIPFSNSLFLK